MVKILARKKRIFCLLQECLSVCFVLLFEIIRKRVLLIINSLCVLSDHLGSHAVDIKHNTIKSNFLQMNLLYASFFFFFMCVCDWHFPF